MIERTRPMTRAVFDAHLMISDPAKYLDEYVKAGCDAITFHIEAVPSRATCYGGFARRGCLAGIALNPKTPVSASSPQSVSAIWCW